MSINSLERGAGRQEDKALTCNDVRREAVHAGVNNDLLEIDSE